MSTSPLVLHATPSAGFDQPFEMLAECHGRIERMLVLLERLSAHLVAHGADEQAQSAARDVMRYFDQAGPRHHEDEERHVLPLLAELGHAALAARLLAEHGEMAAAWSRARVGLDAVVQGRWEPDGAAAAQATWRDLAALYRGHVRTEDEAAYPLASAVMDRERLSAMAADMAERRGVTAPSRD